MNTLHLILLFANLLFGTDIQSENAFVELVAYGYTTETCFEGGTKFYSRTFETEIQVGDDSLLCTLNGVNLRAFELVKNEVTHYYVESTGCGDGFMIAKMVDEEGSHRYSLPLPNPTHCQHMVFLPQISQ